jgi:hypothetical protein
MIHNNKNASSPGRCIYAPHKRRNIQIELKSKIDKSTNTFEHFHTFLSLHDGTCRQNTKQRYRKSAG